MQYATELHHTKKWSLVNATSKMTKCKMHIHIQVPMLASMFM